MPEYRVELPRRYQRRITRFPSHVQRRIHARLDELRTDPNAQFLKALKNRPELSIRVGEYRVLVIRDDARRTFTVTDVDHRGRVY